MPSYYRVGPDYFIFLAVKELFLTSGSQISLRSLVQQPGLGNSSATGNGQAPKLPDEAWGRAAGQECQCGCLLLLRWFPGLSLRACCKCRFSGPTQDALDLNLQAPQEILCKLKSKSHWSGRATLSRQGLLHQNHLGNKFENEAEVQVPN